MKNFTKFCTVFFLLFLLLPNSYGQGFLKADGKRIVNEKGEEVVLRGMGLGGWMLQEGYMLQLNGIAGPQYQIRAKVEELVGPEKTQEFYNAWLANHTRKIDIDSLAAWGFNSVRLPMHYKLFTPPIEEEPVKGKVTWREDGFTITDQLLEWCKANNLYLHATPGGQGHDANISDYDTSKPSLWESEANQQKIVALWRKLAQRYKDEPMIGGYDIINEPNWGFENPADKNGCDEKLNEPLKKLMVEITNAIREVDQKHIVIIEGNCWGNNYSNILPPWDNNMVLSYHKYWNYNNQQAIQNMLDTREKYNVPIWLGETGENSKLWFRDAIQLLEQHKIGWAWWPLKKLGFNNPLEIKVNPGYQKVLDYWRGGGTKPTEAEAYQAFMQLAENSKLENCIYHKDVIDAMFRQVYSNETKPFKHHTIGASAVINAEDYDMGRNGYAYFDKDTANYYISTGGDRTPWNKGHTYRNDGVDIKSGQEKYEAHYVSNMEAGEWLQYTVQAEQHGVYDLQLQVASERGTGKIAVLQNGTVVSNAVAVPETGGEQNWQTVQISGVSLAKRENTLRVKAQSGEFSLNSLQFERKGDKAATGKKAKRKSGK
ncbi:cellulase family glycosylhydrolase [Pontibacter harenae]|uniref:cellulase family glycosylhydrolase n=1 Tax=Pontibacter harenae TaxID=2894083 RepID=UPI001E63A952|nr:cellulase family glycosylhydrolase [Pontibacter harenae]MCC9166179.1 cellulase family glycosylhydrolase [Pontibacter harenae]